MSEEKWGLLSDSRLNGGARCKKWKKIKFRLIVDRSLLCYIWSKRCVLCSIQTLSKIDRFWGEEREKCPRSLWIKLRHGLWLLGWRIVVVVVGAAHTRSKKGLGSHTHVCVCERERERERECVCVENGKVSECGCWLWPALQKFSCKKVFGFFCRESGLTF